MSWIALAAIGSALAVAAGRGKSLPDVQEARTSSRPEVLGVVLVAQAGDEPVDERIRALQRRLAAEGPQIEVLERLGWSFADKAQASSDPGYFTLAERCALAMDEREPGTATARLLRGHALVSLHRFREAEPIARSLVAERGRPFDWALLGDTLMEQGRLDEAIAAYQRMVDLRPDAQAYARIAHVRQLTGDLDGALAVIELATHAASPRNPGTFAWTWARRAVYEAQQGRLPQALASADMALSVAPESAGALAVRGRVLLALERPAEAVEALERAARKNPLPDVLWTLAEALRAVGRAADADAAELRLVSTGAGTDPRGLALFLASHQREVPRALALARRELETRQDVYTWAVLAWSEAAAGDVAAARADMGRALVAGTADPRLDYQAGVIALRAGAHAEARARLERARAHAQLLLPSERTALAVLLDETTSGAPGAGKRNARVTRRRTEA
jgi:tetratricopeptide (TPR) repeat protein